MDADIDKKKKCPKWSILLNIVVKKLNYNYPNLFIDKIVKLIISAKVGVPISMIITALFIIFSHLHLRSGIKHEKIAG